MTVEDVSGYQWIGESWLGEIPGILEPKGPRDQDLVFPHVEDLQRQAKAQIAATERLLATGDFDEADQARLRELNYIIQPILLAPAPQAGDE